jgi:hypothetical protein
MNGKVDWLEYAAAAAVVFFGIGFAGIAATYPLGTLARPGPGFMPLLVGCIIALLGLAVAFEARGKPIETRNYRLRPLIAVSAGIVAFALLVERTGFIPATIALVLLSGLGERREGWLSLLVVAVFMALFGVAFFIWGLGVPLQAIGSAK